MRIITRAEAISLGLKRYFTGEPCKHGHVSERLTSNRKCVGCCEEETKQTWRSKKTFKPTLQASGPYCPTAAMSRNDAMALGLMFYFTGKPCKHGHLAERKVTNNTCQECQRQTYASDAKRYKQIQHHRRNTKCEEVSKNLSNRWNRRKHTKEEKALRAAERRRNRQTRIRNGAKRRAQKLRAVPSWSNENTIKHIYAEAVRLTRETGIIHHVHHIVPLQALTHVSGLHTHHNLIILTEDEHKWFHAKPERLRLLW